MTVAAVPAGLPDPKLEPAIVPPGLSTQPKDVALSIDAFRDPRTVVIYGVDTCEDTTRARARFEAAGRPFRYVRLDVDTGVRDRLHGDGYLATPVVVTPSGDLSVEPSDEELTEIIAATA